MPKMTISGYAITGGTSSHTTFVLRLPWPILAKSLTDYYADMTFYLRRESILVSKKD